MELGSNYKFYVYSENEFTASDISQVYSFQLLSAPSEPYYVEDIFEYRTRDSVTLKWVPPTNLGGADSAKYTVWIKDENDTYVEAKTDIS